MSVHHTPGHCPGGVCLQIGRTGTAGEHLFVGDTLFASSIGRTDLPGGDYETLMQSITQVLFPLGDSAIVHPGHGPDTTIGRERTTNPFVLEISPAAMTPATAGMTPDGLPGADAPPLLNGFPRDEQFQPADLQAVADGEAGAFDPLSVDERAVGALEVAYLQVAVGERGQPAVDARHERGLDDEVGAGGATDGPHASWQNAKSLFRLFIRKCSQHPHRFPRS